MYPELPFTMTDPTVMQFAQMLTAEVDQMHPLLMDDDLEHHITILSTVTQDETEDPLVRHTAILRQQQFWMWLANKQMSAAPPEEEQQQAPQAQSSAFTPSTQQAFNPAQAGTVNAASMTQADSAFTQRTA